MIKVRLGWVTLFLGILTLMGCRTTVTGNVGHMQNFVTPATEAAWIRNGEPVLFEGDPWYPEDGIEVLTDTEMHIVGEHRGIQVFVEKLDIRPYSRLYTKFGHNKFRFYEKEE